MKKDLQLHRPKYRLSGILFSVFIIATLSLTACQPQAMPNTGAGSAQAATPSPSGGSLTQAPASTQTATPSSSGGQTQAPVSSPIVVTSPSAGSQTAVPASSQTVTLVNLTFSPKQLTVPVGTTVVWMNQDSTVHTVSADDQSFDSGNLKPGDSFQFTFTNAGTIAYHCKFHGGPNGVGMAGQIIVMEK